MFEINVFEKFIKLVFCLFFQFMLIVVVMFVMGVVMGQFGCYVYDGVFKLSFLKFFNQIGVKILIGIDVFFNIFRVMSFFYIFYGFCLIFVFYMSLIFMF